MRALCTLLLAVLLAVPQAALAEERGVAIRAGNLMAQPFIDAAPAGQVSANQPVTVVERRGAWILVDAGGQRGWLRLLNVRLGLPALAVTDGAKGKGKGKKQGQNAAGRPSGGSLTNPTAMLRTGSSGSTVATGVKGLDEETIRNASVDTAQIAQLDALGVDPEDARKAAESKKLKENQLAYLKKGDGE